MLTHKGKPLRKTMSPTICPWLNVSLVPEKWAPQIDIAVAHSKSLQEKISIFHRVRFFSRVLGEKSRVGWQRTGDVPQDSFVTGLIVKGIGSTSNAMRFFGLLLGVGFSTVCVSFVVGIGVANCASNEGMPFLSWDGVLGEFSDGNLTVSLNGAVVFFREQGAQLPKLRMGNFNWLFEHNPFDIFFARRRS